MSAKSKGSLTRSVINKSVRDALKIAAHFNWSLPPFAHWSLEQWENSGAEADELRECMLGFDVTDFGSGDFENIGRVLFTVRNGKSSDPRFPKAYAEKLLIDPEIQRAPAHFHRKKREDIICRHGGNIMVQLTKATPEGKYSDESFTIQVNGITRTLTPGTTVRLTPGESLTIPPYTIHQFWAEEGTGWEMEGKRYSLTSEISSVSDDWNDNVFFEDWGVRFPNIIEDEPRQFYLCHEYPKPKDAKTAE